MIYIAAIFAALFCALAALYVTALNQFVRIVSSQDEDTPGLRFSGYLKHLPIIGTKTSTVESLVAHRKRRCCSYATRSKWYDLVV